MSILGNGWTCVWEWKALWISAMIFVFPQTSYPVGTRISFSGGKAAWAWCVTIHLYLMRRSRMHGAIPPFSQMPSWRDAQLKAQEQIYLFLPSFLPSLLFYFTSVALLLFSYSSFILFLHFLHISSAVFTCHQFSHTSNLSVVSFRAPPLCSSAPSTPFLFSVYNERSPNLVPSHVSASTHLSNPYTPHSNTRSTEPRGRFQLQNQYLLFTSFTSFSVSMFVRDCSYAICIQHLLKAIWSSLLSPVRGSGLNLTFYFA
jgi:hypothetical protein